MRAGRHSGRHHALVGSQVIRLVGVGLAIGALGAVAATRLLTRMLIGVSSTNLLSFAGVIVLLTLSATVASLIPARRASIPPWHCEGSSTTSKARTAT